MTTFLAGHEVAEGARVCSLVFRQDAYRQWRIRVKPLPKPSTVPLLAALALILAACAAAPATEQTVQQPADQPTLQAIDVVAADELTITYGEDGCRYDGPAGVAQGKVSVTLQNPSDAKVQISVFRFDAGETWQQLVDAFAAKNTGIEYPRWALDVEPSDGRGVLSGRPVLDNLQAKIYELTPGSYGLSCEEFPPDGTIVIHLASPLEVR